MERMERDRITKRVYVRECADSHTVGRLQKKWIDTVFKEKEVWMSGKQGEFSRIGVKGNIWGVAQGMNP